jgi:hypothetical protein
MLLHSLASSVVKGSGNGNGSEEGVKKGASYPDVVRWSLHQEKVFPAVALG